MQISHENSKVAQVSFGVRSNRVARMAESSAFFHILSASLYSIPLLAVAREIICNADDAHKQNNVDRPIEITFNESENMISVKDFGPGIPDDLMDDIYLVFGESTKKTDDKATGGFGLGSKAPWALVDQFYVTSCHNGTKTIYTLVKSDPDNEGKPSIQTMYSGPTEETGLEVRIPADATTRSRFQAYAKAVIYFGDIKALHRTINEDDDLTITDFIEYDVLGMEDVPGTLRLVKNDSWGRPQFKEAVANVSNDRIYVRYGAVIYPITVRMDLPTIPDHTWIIQAAPSSLTLNPSREVLTYDDTTLESLKELIEAVHRSLKKVPHYREPLPKVINAVYDRIKEITDDEARRINQLRMFHQVYRVGHINTKHLNDHFKEYMVEGASGTIKSLMDYEGERYCIDAARKINSATKGIWKDVLYTLFVESGATPAQARREVTHIMNYRDVFHLTPVAFPKRFKKNWQELAEVLDGDRPMVSELDMVIEPYRTRYFSMNFFQINILAKRINIIRLLGDANKNSSALGAIYLRTTSSRKAKEWEKRLTDLGWNVNFLWSEPEARTTTAKSKPVISSKLGYPKASLAINSTHFDPWDATRVVAALEQDRDGKNPSLRILTPKAYIKGSISRSKAKNPIELSTRLFGSKLRSPLFEDIAFVTSDKQVERLKKQGVPELSSYLVQLFNNLPDNGIRCVVEALTYEDGRNWNHELTTSEATCGYFMFLAHLYPFPQANEILEWIRVRSLHAYPTNYIRPTNLPSDSNHITVDLLNRYKSLPAGMKFTPLKYVDYRELFEDFHSGRITADIIQKQYFT